MSIKVGDVLGDYRVTGVLGRGGMAKVFRVRSLLTDREEAMKMLLADSDENPELRDRFLREMRVHARLEHPNIAALRTALRIDDRLFLVMELVQGTSLDEKLRQGPLASSRAVECIEQVLAGLACAHDAGVVHRDIKPANILIGDDGMVKLTDFGVARPIDETRLTGTGFAVGTLAYMSPEQVRAEPVDARSDLYSVGLTLYEMITGRRAMPGDTAQALMNAQLTILPAVPVELNPMVPPAVSTAIMRAVAKNPDRRFQTAKEFKAALAGLGSAQPATPVLTPNVTPTAEVTTAAGVVSFDERFLESLVRALAPYLGPIAKVLVSRAARGARNVEELRETLAAELPSADDRRAFLARVRSVP